MEIDNIESDSDRSPGGIAGITRAHNETELETTSGLLRIVNEAGTTADLVRAVAIFFQQQSGCEAVGIRLREGDDYPYGEARGFPAEFVLLEDSLCAKDEFGGVIRDSSGDTVLECMCGNIICGRFDPSKPFFTEGGSFWTNSTTQLLASTSEADRIARTRNRCNTVGYESVALIPVTVGNERLGLLQLNDHRKGMFSPQTIALWERLAAHLAIALSRSRNNEVARQSEAGLRLAAEAANLGTYSYDHTSNTGCYSPEFMAMYGLGPNDTLELDTDTAPVAIIDEDREAFLAAVAAGNDPSGDGVMRVEFRIRRPDGAIRWLQVRGRTTFQGSYPVDAAGVLIDITDRKRAEEELWKSKTALSAIMESTQDLIWSVDAERFGLTAFNSRMQHYFAEHRGTEIEIGMTPDDLFPSPEWAEKARGLYQRALREGPFAEEYTIFAGINVLALSFNLLTHEDEVVGISVFGQDITERKAAERALVESERKYRDLIENAGEGVMTVDADNVLTFANQSLADMLGYTPDEMVGKPLIGFVAPDHVAEAEKLFELYLSGEWRHTNSAYVDKNGVEVPVRLVAWPVYDPNGDYSGAMAFVTDMRELRHMEAQMRQLQRLDAIGSLVGGVSHEFRNLLLGISACGELLQAGLGSDHAQISVTYDLLHCVDRARKLIDKLLAFGKRQQIAPRPTDLNAMVSELEGLLSRMMGEHNRIEVELAPEPVVVNVDAGQIELVLINLAINAHDAMPGGGKLTIRVGRRRITRPEDIHTMHPKAREYAEIAVEDNGFGMDAATRERIFEPFFTTKDSVSHNGLGLSVAYGIVQQHEGHIAVSSKVGVGSRFIVRIPTVSLPPLPTTKVERAPVPRGTETILLVEDEELVRLPLKSALEGCGYRVFAAADGLEAVEVYREIKERIDLIISDLAMPRAGGAHVYEAISTESPDTRFLFISGYMPSAFDPSFVPPDGAILLKPFSVSELASKVRQLLDNGTGEES